MKNIGEIKELCSKVFMYWFMEEKENPGQSQIILKDLLLSIKSKKGPIPSGYVITSNDFSLAFPFSFPIMEIPEVNKKYEKLWDKQKRKKENPLESDNLCDTVDWWKEVML